MIMSLRLLAEVDYIPYLPSVLQLELEHWAETRNENLMKMNYMR